MMCGCIDDGCMHGNMDWWIAACKDGWMHIRVHGACLQGWKGAEWIDYGWIMEDGRWMDRCWMDEWMGRRMSE